MRTDKIINFYSKLSKWEKDHEELVYGSIEHGYQPDKYTNEIIAEFLSQFSFSEDIHAISAQSFFYLAHHFIEVAIDYGIGQEQLKQELDQIARFCCFEILPTDDLTKD